MIKKDAFFLNLPQLRRVYCTKFPKLIEIAISSSTLSLFKDKLRYWINSHEALDNENTLKKATVRYLHLLLDYDDQQVDELSTGEKLSISTIAYLWQFLTNKELDGLAPDLFIDLYYQFCNLVKPQLVIPDRSIVKKQMSRWPTGLDASVMAIREENKKRIVQVLIRKVERRYGQSTRYQFVEGISYEEKKEQVLDWWNSSRFHLAMAVKSPTELNLFLGNTLSDDTLRLLLRAKKKGMPFFITPYYLSLLNTTENGYDDEAIRSYILYSTELVDTYGNIKAWEKEDVVVGGEPNAAGWLLPEGRNIHRRYPEVSILIPDSMGRACGGLCASCQRMYDFQSERLNFNFEALKPKEIWEKKLRRLMQYFEDDARLRDILITGGDAFMSQNSTLRRILDAVYKMALRKKKANENREDGKKYAELQRVRLGTRLLAYLPLRVTPELVDILREFKEKAFQIGIQQFYIQTHFQTALEITPEAKKAVEAIQSAGWIVTNQLVYTVSSSRRGHTAKLRQALNSIGVVCYYTFSVKGFRENYAVFTPNSRSLQEANEEKIYGIVPDEKRQELHKLLQNQQHIGKNLPRFLKENNLLFAGTDRNVLNLPGIGKSMTFQTVGITAEGKRILRFDHDSSRLHSPIINKMQQVYIVENKSVAAYLRQLKEMGEDVGEYKTIWYYTEGETEPRFSIYEYPKYTFKVTQQMTNLQLES